MNGSIGFRWAPLVVALALGGCSSQDKPGAAQKSTAPPQTTTEVSETAKSDSIPVEEDREESATNSINASNVKDEVSKLEKEINP